MISRIFFSVCIIINIFGIIGNSINKEYCGVLISTVGLLAAIGGIILFGRKNG
jgi:hypothetical protein